MAHAILSPSSSKRWMTCPGSVALAANIKDESSSYAEEGTCAHWVAENILRGTFSESEAVGRKCPENGVEVTPDMVRDVMRYVTQVRDIVAATGGTLYLEQKLPIGQWTGEVGAKGTADAVIDAGDELIVIDLKFGRGVEVEAEENSQLMLYALGALDKFGKVDDVEDLL